MIPDVPQACDEFGSYLAQLRAERRMTAKALSLAAGMSPSYISGWEANPRAVNKQVLHQVAAALKLADAERYELFRLADKRAGVDEMRHGRGPWEQVFLNVTQVLAEVSHEIDPSVSKEALAQCSELASWLFANYAYYGRVPEHKFCALDWPEILYRERILSPARDAHHRFIPIPEELREQELSDLESLFPLTEESSQRVALRLGNTYRRWLLTSLDRCRQIAQTLGKWAITEDSDVGAVVTFTFKEVGDETTFGIPGIEIKTATTHCRREVCSSLFISENARGAANHHDPFTVLPFRIEDVDFAVIAILGMARLYLQGTHPAKPRQLRQFIRNAWHLVNPDALDYGFLEYASAMRSLFAPEGSIPAGLDTGELWEKTRIAMLDTLDEAANKLDREARQASPTSDQAKGTQPKSGKKGKHR